MKFKVDTGPFIEALKDLQKVAPSESVTLIANKGLFVSSTSTGASIEINVEKAKVEEKGKCTVPYATLEGVLRKRKEATFELDNKVLNFKASSSSKYAGNLTLLPFQEIKIEEEKDLLKLKEDELSKLAEIVSNVSLLSINLKKQDLLPICIKLGEKGIEASCASRNHMAYANYKKVKFDKEHEFVVIPGIIPLIDAVAKKSKYKLSITENCVYAANDSFRIRFITQQIDRFVKLDMVKKFLKDREEPDASIKAKTEDITSIFQNLLSLYEVNSFIELSVKDKEITASTKTKYGEASEKIKGEVKGKIKKAYSIHPKVFEDLISKCKSNTIDMGFHSGKSISLEQSKSDVKYMYSCSVSSV